MRLPVALAFAALAAPAAAGDFADAATGFAVRPPAPYTAEAVTRAQFDVGAGLRSTTGVPPVAGVGEHVCVAGFKAVEANAGLTQRDINIHARGKEWRDTVRASIGLIFHIDALRTAAIGDVGGVELQARPKFGPEGYQDARIFMALHETPKGRVTMICSTTKAAFARALGGFRAVRATIAPPK